MGVSIRPGKIAFTRTPYSAFSMARFCVIALIAALLVLYASMVGRVQSDAVEEILIMTPDPWARITGRTCLIVRNMPFEVDVHQ